MSFFSLISQCTYSQILAPICLRYNIPLKCLRQPLLNLVKVPHWTHKNFLALFTMKSNYILLRLMPCCTYFFLLFLLYILKMTYSSYKIFIPAIMYSAKVIWLLWTLTVSEIITLLFMLPVESIAGGSLLSDDPIVCVNKRATSKFIIILSVFHFVIITTALSLCYIVYI